MRVTRTQYAVPGWGAGELWTSEEAVVAHDFRFEPVSDTARSGRAAVLQAGPAFAVTHAAEGLTPSGLVDRFDAFLAGEPDGFHDVPLDLGELTDFQRRVAGVLRAIPRGEVVSYGELAALAGYPRAQRAAGTFCARNRFMFLLPCHRVVSSAGIGGYGSAGVGVKRRLLALEGVQL